MQFSRVSLRCAQPSYTSCFNFKEWVLYLYMELESQASALRHIAWACWIYISPKMPGKQYAHPSILWPVSGSEVCSRDRLPSQQQRHRLHPVLDERGSGSTRSIQSTTLPA